MQEDSVQAGITGEPAPELGVTQWIDAAGQPLADYGLDKMRGKFKLVFCFQDACPGCHLTGFPSLVRVVEAFRGSPFVSFAAAPTAASTASFVFDDIRSTPGFRPQNGTTKNSRWIVPRHAGRPYPTLVGWRRAPPRPSTSVTRRQS